MNFHGRRIHLMGIGGIGVSSVAQIAMRRGAVVSGCDRADGEMLRRLRGQGIHCFVGHDPSHLDDIDTLVFSTAVSRYEPELRAARAGGIEVIHRAELLAWLAEGRHLIGVAGTHGKTSTTWLVANLLISANLDPTVMLGGNVDKLGGNFRTGDGPLFVTEVDESDGSLLHLAPKWSVLTNVELDHVDCYPRGLEQVKETFAAYIRQTRSGGTLFACSDCAGVRELLEDYPDRAITYGMQGSPDVAARNIELAGGYSIFDVVWRGAEISRVWLSLPGEHNVQNALAAIAIGLELGVPTYRIEDALAHTPTVKRRLERRGQARGITVLDDYGHHPTEIKTTVAAAREIAGGRLIGVFQPHRYTRTKHMWKEFAEALESVDVLFITSVYAASEKPIAGADGEKVHLETIRRGHQSSTWISELNHVAEQVTPVLQEGDTVLTMGAGNVWTVGDAVLHRLSHQEVVRG